MTHNKADILNVNLIIWRIVWNGMIEKGLMNERSILSRNKNEMHLTNSNPQANSRPSNRNPNEVIENSSARTQLVTVNCEWKE